jgi:tetratricopeptide (TPR) repeat protein
LKQLIAASTIKYQMVADKDAKAADAPATGQVLPSWLRVVVDGQRRHVEMPKPPANEVQKAFSHCEETFGKRDFKAAAACFEEVRKLDPSFTPALTNMGDSLYQAKDFARAKECLTKAAEENPADYQVHWFLGDTLWYVGEKERAIEELTIAHLLNVNHPALKEHLVQARRAIGRPWNAWQFRPRFSTDKQGDTVVIRHAPQWKGYALVKAVWKYEPGFAERFGGADYAKLAICMPEELGALQALAAEEPAAVPVGEIVKGGFSTEMIMYELLLPRAPVAMLVLTKQQQMRIVEYLQKYH